MKTIVNETKHIIIMEAALPFIKIALDLGVASNDPIGYYVYKVIRWVFRRSLHSD